MTAHAVTTYNAAAVAAHSCGGESIDTPPELHGRRSFFHIFARCQQGLSPVFFSRSQCAESQVQFPRSTLWIKFAFRRILVVVVVVKSAGHASRESNLPSAYSKIAHKTIICTLAYYVNDVISSTGRTHSKDLPCSSPGRRLLTTDRFFIK